MKTLEFPFSRSGFRHELIERSGLVCLVKQNRIGKSYWAYEIVKLRTEPDKIRFGNFVPAHERYPSDEDWGTYGFTYRHDELTKAREQFAKMASALALEPKTGHPSALPGSDMPVSGTRRVLTAAAEELSAREPGAEPI